MTLKRTLTLIAPPVLWAGLIFFSSSLPDLKSGLHPAWDTLLRKLAHATEYGIFAVLLARVGFHEAHRRSSSVIYAVAWVAAALYAVSDELHQTVVPGRTGHPLDVTIDSLGAAVGLAIYERQRTRPRFGQTSRLVRPTPLRAQRSRRSSADR